MVDIDDVLCKIDEVVVEGCDGVVEDVVFYCMIVVVIGNLYFLKMLQFLNQYFEVGVKVMWCNEVMCEDFLCQVCDEYVVIVDVICVCDLMVVCNVVCMYMYNVVCCFVEVGIC